MSPAPTDPRNRRRLVALIAAGIVLLLLAGIGVYGLLTGPRTSTSNGCSRYGCSTGCWLWYGNAAACGCQCTSTVGPVYAA